MKYTIEAKGELFTGTLSVSRQGSAAIAELRRALIDLGMAHSTEPPQFPREFPCCDQGSLSGELVTGIASYKLTTAGEEVSTVECREAIGAYDKAIAAGALHPDAFGADFVMFLRLAASGRGFRVS